METPRYDTTPVRLMLALPAGAFAGTVVMLAWAIVGQLIAARNTPENPYALATLLGMSPLFGLIVFVVFAGGMLLVGAPLWALLHRWGYRSWRAASALGAIASFAAGLIFITLPQWSMPSETRFSASDAGGPTIVDNRRTLHGWEQALMQAGIIGLAGLFAGLTVWRVAYRRVD